MPEAPTITTVSAINSTHLLVEFMAPQSPIPITHYTIYVNRTERGLPERSFVADGPELSLQVGQFTPYEEVSVQVSASGTSGEGPRSVEVVVRTNEGSK